MVVRVVAVVGSFESVSAAAAAGAVVYVDVVYVDVVGVVYCSRMLSTFSTKDKTHIHRSTRY